MGKERSKDLGYLFVVGGPGASGSSTISKMLAKHFNLQYVYAGGLVRDIVKEKGFEDLTDALDEKFMSVVDKEVDMKIQKLSQMPNILIDSKVFSGIATAKDIPCTVRIWIAASLHVRALRALSKENSPFSVIKYFQKRRDLKERFFLDAERYLDLYGIDYTIPEKYNDIVIDSSSLNEEETFNLIFKKLEDGGYI